MLADYLAAGALIVARLTTWLPGVSAVRQAAARQAVNESALGAMTVLVVYDGDRLGDEAGRGRAQIVHQQWLVLLAVRHATQGDGGAAQASLAGPLLSRLLEALSGWAPSAEHRPLTRISAPRPVHTPGFTYYPLAFECAVSTVGAA